MNYRKAVQSDLPQIMLVIEEARANLKEQGIDQWQNGVPNETLILEDIEQRESYVLLCEHKIIGYLTIDLNGEPCYQTIYDGSWNTTDENYGTIHRTAISNEGRGRGFANYLFEIADKVCLEHNKTSIRIDTHEDNKRMHHLILKNGFTYCGNIYLLSDGSKRLAFEKIFA